MMMMVTAFSSHYRLLRGVLVPGLQGVSHGLLVSRDDLPKSYPVNGF